MGRSSEEAAQTRKTIVAAAADHIRRTGIAEASLADIMAAAGLTHGGFYRHFRNKEQLVAEAISAAGTHTIETITRAMDAARDEFFAGSRLALDQHRRRCRRNDRHLFDHIAKCRTAADDAVRGVAPDVLAQVVVFEFQLLLQLFDLPECARVRDRDRRVVGKRTKPREGATIARIAIEHAQDPQDLAVEDERLATKAADTLVVYPIRASDPIVIADHIFNEEPVAARADAADLPHTKGKSPERSIQPRPVRTVVQGRPGTRRQMKAPGLIWALSAERARGANIPGRNQPHTGQRHCRVANQALDDLIEDAIDRRFRGDR